MRTYRDAKSMAKSLRAGLADQGIQLSHSTCLELVAKEFGVRDWNHLAATLDDKVWLNHAIPIIRIFSVEKAKEFYLDFLGFTLRWEHRFDENAPLYAEIARSDLTLHISEHHGDGAPGTTIFVAMSGIAELHEELSAKHYRYGKPGIESQNWGALTITVTDPFGNCLRFAEADPASRTPDGGQYTEHAE